MANPIFNPKQPGITAVQQEYYEALLNPSTHGTSVALKLTPQILVAAVRKLELQISKEHADKAEHVRRMGALRWAYKQRLKDKQAEKAFRDMLELEEEFDYETEAQAYLSGKSTKKPSVVAAAALIPVEHVYFNFELLKGSAEEFQAKFAQWLNEVKLAGMGFALVVQNKMLMLQGPAQSPHRNTLSLFLQQLVAQGYISPAAQPVVAPSLASPTAGLGFAPKPVPTAGRKNVAEEEEEKNARGHIPLRPRAPGEPPRT